MNKNTIFTKCTEYVNIILQLHQTFDKSWMHMKIQQTT
jgi:hypothetical protein